MLVLAGANIVESRQYGLSGIRQDEASVSLAWSLLSTPHTSCPSLIVHHFSRPSHPRARSDTASRLSCQTAAIHTLVVHVQASLLTPTSPQTTTTPSESGETIPQRLLTGDSVNLRQRLERHVHYLLYSAAKWKDKVLLVPLYRNRVASPQKFDGSRLVLSSAHSLVSYAHVHA